MLRAMPRIPRIDLDATDHRILEHLQRDGRLSVADLARAIALSPSATADRVRRLTDAGVITGYSATVDPVRPRFPAVAGATLYSLVVTAQPAWRGAGRGVQRGQECALLAGRQQAGAHNVRRARGVGRTFGQLLQDGRLHLRAHAG